MSLAYDIHIAWDPRVADTPADRARLQKRLAERQQVVRALLPRLRKVIENPKRKPDDVFQVLRSYYQQAGRDLPMTPEDLPEIETQARLVLGWVVWSRIISSGFCCGWSARRRRRDLCPFCWGCCTSHAAATILGLSAAN